MKNTSRTAMEIVENSGLFDEIWYATRYPDVATLGISPIEHYLWLGARLGRNPSRNFDTRAYLAANADIAAAGINPLLHYIERCHAEGRRAGPLPHNNAPDTGTSAYPWQSAGTALPFLRRRRMDGQRILTQARNREHFWYCDDAVEAILNRTHEIAPLPAHIRRLLVISGRGGFPAGATQSISHYLNAMSARGGHECTSIELAPGAPASAAANHMATHDFTIVDSVAPFMEHDGLIDLICKAGPRRAAIYMHETADMFDRLKAKRPDRFAKFAEALPELGILCVSPTQQSRLREAYGARQSFVVCSAAPAFEQIEAGMSLPAFVTGVNTAIAAFAGDTKNELPPPGERIAVLIATGNVDNWPGIRAGLAALHHCSHTLTLIDPGGTDGEALRAAVAHERPDARFLPPGLPHAHAVELVAHDHDMIVGIFGLRGTGDGDTCEGLLASATDVDRILAIFRDHPDVDTVVPRARRGEVWRSEGAFWARASKASVALAGAAGANGTVFHDEQLPRPVSLLKDRHKGEDIHVIGSGASGNFLDPSYFEGKTTIGINRVFRRFPCTYTVLKEFNGAAAHAELCESGSIPVVARGESGNLATGSRQSNSLFFREPGTYFFDHLENGLRNVDMSPIGSAGDRLVVSWSSITSAMHLAALMGARNIVLVGHDCGLVDGESTIDGYYANMDNAPWGSTTQYNDWLDEIEAQTIAVRSALKAAYGCNVVSLNPFVNFGLEGHSYVRTGGTSAKRNERPKNRL